MESPQISLVRYWNYIVSPLVAVIAIFGVYTITTLKSIQTMNASQIVEGINRMKRKNNTNQ